jgi:hypothetical protein
MNLHHSYASQLINLINKSALFGADSVSWLFRLTYITFLASPDDLHPSFSFHNKRHHCE